MQLLTTGAGAALARFAESWGGQGTSTRVVPLLTSQHSCPGLQECLPASILQCAASEGGGGCSRCRRGTKMVTATRAPAAYSLASRPQQGGFCREWAEKGCSASYPWSNISALYAYGGLA